MAPSYKPRNALKTRRSGAEASEGPFDEHAATAIDRPLVDESALEQAKLKQRVERERRGHEEGARARRTLALVGVLIVGLALAAGAGFGAYLALSS